MNLRSSYQNLCINLSWILPCYLPRTMQIFYHHDETDRPDGGGDIYTITQYLLGNRYTTLLSRSHRIWRYIDFLKDIELSWRYRLLKFRRRADTPSTFTCRRHISLNSMPTLIIDSIIVIYGQFYVHMCSTILHRGRFAIAILAREN